MFGKNKHSEGAGRVAVFGDIHANLEALSAVLKDASKNGISRFFCTGDIVGYAASPSECLRRVRKLNCPVVLGNHDAYVSKDEDLENVKLEAGLTILWTRKQLKEKEKNWLLARPLSMDFNQGATREPRAEGERSKCACCLVHSSLPDPAAWNYVMNPVRAERLIRAQAADVVFFGHTHVPSIFAFNPQTEMFSSECPAKEGLRQLEPGFKYLINPGSVGQPRDRDPRASFALFNPNTASIEIRRIEYDITSAQQKIKSAGLPIPNAERLSQGR
jgi:predicted phosphodiesterase